MATEKYARPEMLADPAWLLPKLGREDVRVVDCSSEPGYRRAHIPDAVHLGVDPFIKGPAEDGRPYGLHVMPADDFAALMGRLGISASTTVVAYDDDSNHVAPRLWWALRYYGHQNVRVLNGDWNRWVNGDYEVSNTVPDIAPATFEAVPDPARMATLEQLAEASRDGTCQILDARPREEYEGGNSRGNLRTGHIPGARNLEWRSFVNPERHAMFRPADEMRALLDQAGITADGAPVITYCQGGIRAAHAAFVLELLGYDGVRVYDASMGEWANREDTALTA